ncbi:MAG: hypothetical protein FWG25_05545, partial [Promicromonosporaceae bacterium]|nr:hypothetical protein [Promicromonosporaceae bacterium]
MRGRLTRLTPLVLALVMIAGCGADVVVDPGGAVATYPEVPCATVDEPYCSGSTLDIAADFVAGEITPGLPDGLVPQFSMMEWGVAWSPDPDVLYVFTAGSSGCAILASTTASGDASGINVALSSQSAGGEMACPADRVMSTTRVSIPPGVDNGEPLVVHFLPDGTSIIQDPETVTVPPRAVAGEMGRAAWAPLRRGHQLNADTLQPFPDSWALGIPSWLSPPENGALAGAGLVASWFAGEPATVLLVVTWGSSSCPAIAINATATGPDSVSVQLSSQGTEPCTRDWVPLTSYVLLPAGVDTAIP